MSEYVWHKSCRADGVGRRYRVVVSNGISHVVEEDGLIFILPSDQYVPCEVATSVKNRRTIIEEPPDFKLFWMAYPKKVGGRKHALKAWLKARDRPHIDIVLNAIERQKQSEQWRKNDGAYIPHAATWLNQGRWADEVKEQKKSLMEEFLTRGGTLARGGTNGQGTVLPRVAATHFSAMGQAVSRANGHDQRAASDGTDPARAVLQTSLVE